MIIKSETFPLQDSSSTSSTSSTSSSLAIRSDVHETATPLHMMMHNNDVLMATVGTATATANRHVVVLPILDKRSFPIAPSSIDSSFGWSDFPVLGMEDNDPSVYPTGSSSSGLGWNRDRSFDAPAHYGASAPSRGQRGSYYHDATDHQTVLNFFANHQDDDDDDDDDDDRSGISKSFGRRDDNHRAQDGEDDLVSSSASSYDWSDDAMDDATRCDDPSRSWHSRARYQEEQDFDAKAFLGRRRRKRSATVGFSVVEIRSYDVVLGDHSYPSGGFPLSLDWSHDPVPLSMAVEEHQCRRHHHMKQRSNPRPRKLTLSQRRDVLRSMYECSESHLLQLERERISSDEQRRSPQQQQHRGGAERPRFPFESSSSLSTVGERRGAENFEIKSDERDHHNDDDDDGSEANGAGRNALALHPSRSFETNLAEQAQEG